MKNKDLLNILGDIDENLVADAAPDFDKVRGPVKATPTHKHRKNSRTWVKFVAVAACCSLIVCGVLAAGPIFNKINFPDIFGPGGSSLGDSADDETESPAEPADTGKNNGGDQDNAQGEDISGNGSHASPSPVDTLEGDRFPETEYLPGWDESASGSQDVEPDYVYCIEIKDERFKNYEFPGNFIKPELVGDLIAEITVDCSYGYEVTSINAEIYAIKEIPSELCVCIRFLDDGIDNYADEVLPLDAYCLLWAVDYSFESFDNMHKTLSAGGRVYPGEYAGYNKNTDEIYCKSFHITDAVANELARLLASVDGTAVDVDGDSKLASVQQNANESLQIACSFGGNLGFVSGLLYVYDNGYMHYTSLGGQLFDIGEENARKLIDFVIKNGSPDGYIWNENAGKWYPIDPDDSAEYSNFSMALEETKLMGQLELYGSIAYWEICFGGISPSSLTLNSKMMLVVAEIICASDGEAVIIDAIEKLAGQSMTFTYVDIDTTPTCEITVYDSGHIWFNGYYYVGEDYTNKIINTVCNKCEADSGYVWDSKNRCWVLGDNVSGNEKETAPADSVDHGYGYDVYDTEVEP